MGAGQDLEIIPFLTIHREHNPENSSHMLMGSQNTVTACILPLSLLLK